MRWLRRLGYLLFWIWVALWAVLFVVSLVVLLRIPFQPQPVPLTRDEVAVAYVAALAVGDTRRACELMNPIRQDGTLDECAARTAGLGAGSLADEPRVVPGLPDKALLVEYRTTAAQEPRYHALNLQPPDDDFPWQVKQDAAVTEDDLRGADPARAALARAADQLPEPGPPITPGRVAVAVVTGLGIALAVGAIHLFFVLIAPWSRRDRAP